MIIDNDNDIFNCIENTYKKKKNNNHNHKIKYSTNKTINVIC